MHTAIIAKIDRVDPIEGANTIQKAYCLGTQLIVGKEAKEGDIGILFPSELQLSADYCKENNLYRHAELNKDPTKAGFFDDNRRVRAQPFLKVKSDGYFAQIESLSYTGYDISKLKIGDMFDELGGISICTKYISQKTRAAMASRPKKQKQVETPLFYKHPDTDNIKYYIDAIPKGALISIQSKTHGTSGRYSLSKTYRTLPSYRRIINRIYPFFSNESWEYLVGTRNCVLFEEQNEKLGFHGSEQFRFDVLEILKPHLTKGLNIYLEIFGYANGSPIMPRHETSKIKDKRYEKKYGKQITYNYGCLDGTFNYKIYRISSVAESGESLDFAQEQLKHWCEIRNLNCCQDIIPSFIYDGDKSKLEELIEELTERPEKLTEDYIDPTSISEGIVIRVDYKELTPKFYKKKSWAFSVMEGFAKENEVDIEDAS